MQEIIAQILTDMLPDACAIALSLGLGEKLVRTFVRICLGKDFRL